MDYSLPGSSVHGVFQATKVNFEFNPWVGKIALVDYVLHTVLADFQGSLLFFFFGHTAKCGILVPWPGIKPVSSALQIWSLNHWTTREVPMGLYYSLHFTDKKTKARSAQAACPIFFLKGWVLVTCPVLSSVSSVQLLSHVLLFATPWIAAHQASLSITNSRSSLKLMSIESVILGDKKCNRIFLQSLHSA